MTVCIHWRPCSEVSAHFEGGTSSSLASLTKVFGNSILPENIPALRAMAIASNDKFYDEVADVVERVGAINIWGEY